MCLTVTLLQSGSVSKGLVQVSQGPVQEWAEWSSWVDQSAVMWTLDWSVVVKRAESKGDMCLWVSLHSYHHLRSWTVSSDREQDHGNISVFLRWSWRSGPLCSCCCFWSWIHRWMDGWIIRTQIVVISSRRISWIIGLKAEQSFHVFPGETMRTADNISWMEASALLTWNRVNRSRSVPDRRRRRWPPWMTSLATENQSLIIEALIWNCHVTLDLSFYYPETQLPVLQTTSWGSVEDNIDCMRVSGS